MVYHRVVFVTMHLTNKPLGLKVLSQAISLSRLSVNTQKLCGLHHEGRISADKMPLFYDRSCSAPSGCGASFRSSNLGGTIYYINQRCYK